MLHGEWMTMPMLAGTGLLGGLLRDLAPDPEEIWKFSPVFDLLGGYRFFRKGWDAAQSGFQVAFLAAVLGGVFLYSFVAALFGPKVLVPIVPPSPWMAAGYITLVFCIAVPLKIWSSALTERKLESQGRLLVEARLAALTNQINPHFLFNTLNSIGALIRVDPDEARSVLYKLSSILRRLLRKPEALAPLREELAFVDDYLAIEQVRFGDKLRIAREIDPETLHHPVPTMMLQPLVENSIRHGLAGQVAGGTITLRSRRENSRLIVTIEDNGAGIAEDKLKELFSNSGIGISNVNERLRVLFQDRYRMTIDSREGEGTRTQIELPLLASERTESPGSLHREPSNPSAPAEPKTRRNR
jgi:two-component system LytT family sensor kinase